MHKLLLYALLVFIDYLWIALYFGERFGQDVTAIQGEPVEVNMTYAFISYIPISYLHYKYSTGDWK